jgi:hypothetical protein
MRLVRLLAKQSVEPAIVAFHCIVGPILHFNVASVLFTYVPRRENGHPLPLEINPELLPHCHLPLRNWFVIYPFNHCSHKGDSILLNLIPR